MSSLWMRNKCVCGSGEIDRFPYFPKSEARDCLHRVLVAERPIKLRPVTLVSSVLVLHQVFGEPLKGGV